MAGRMTPPRRWLAHSIVIAALNPFERCASCNHLGFSHDNWGECAECECEEFVEGEPA